jgi:hypothetical protein
MLPLPPLRLAAFIACAFVSSALAQAPDQPWLYTKARALPIWTTNQGSGYFSIVEGKNGRLYIGAAKYGVSSYLVEYDPVVQQFRVVVDTMREIGSTATGFAAQSKIHTRNNVGASGKIYFGTKQGYPDKTKEEKLEDYPGGYPMVYDPETNKTRVYPIPIPHQPAVQDQKPQECPGATVACREVLSLPLYPSLTPSELAVVASAVCKFQEG